MKMRLNCVAASVLLLLSAGLIIPQAKGAIESREILKTFFETGDVPTQDQFSNFIDSYIHQTDDGLTLFAIGASNDGSPSSALRVGKNVGVNETLPDTKLHVWRAASQSAPEMCPEFCGLSGFLPLKYEDAVGMPHYGFLQIEMGTDPGVSPGAEIFVRQWVWESSANTTLTTFAVPEPAGAAMVFVAISMTLLGRRMR
jgi:hypothetical protein